MNRRQFFECSVLLVAGCTASQAGFSLNREQQTYLASASDYIARVPDLFTPEQRKDVEVACEHIIPASDTPGANEAGAPRFVELMVAEWCNDKERAVFMAGLESLQDAAGGSFYALNSAQQLMLLEQFEERAADSSWYDLGGAFLRKDLEDTPFICQLKELTIWGFFTSEVGAKKVLRYNPMPMQYKGDIPLLKDDSSWAGKDGIL